MSDCLGLCFSELLWSIRFFWYSWKLYLSNSGLVEVYYKIRPPEWSLLASQKSDREANDRAFWLTETASKIHFIKCSGSRKSLKISKKNADTFVFKNSILGGAHVQCLTFCDISFDLRMNFLRATSVLLYKLTVYFTACRYKVKLTKGWVLENVTAQKAKLHSGRHGWKRGVFHGVFSPSFMSLFADFKP